MILTLITLLALVAPVSAARPVFPDIIPLPVGSQPEGIAVGRGAAFYTGSLLYVVRNQLNQVAVVDLNADYTAGVVVETLTHPAFQASTTAADFGNALYSGFFLLFIYLIGRWDWLSYYLRYLLAAALVIVLYTSYRKARGQPFLPATGGLWRQGQSGMIANVLIGLAFAVYALIGLFYRGQPVWRFHCRAAPEAVGQNTAD